jgi:hypothetical protein
MLGVGVDFGTSNSTVAFLEDLFPGKVTVHDPFTSVAGGLAIASFHGYQQDVPPPQAWATDVA